MGKKVKGYKAFNSDWTCQDYQYSCPGIFEMDKKPKMCSRGFHFCQKITDCFTYYCFNSDTKIAEVEALGKVKFSNEDSKCCTNKLSIIRELPWEEVLSLSNIGKDCYGLKNIGSSNDGDYNIGFGNVGNKNIGNLNYGGCNIGNNNLGHKNVGDSNSGDANTGKLNYGNWNAGNHNIGDYNTGDWNTASHCSGCFMTDQQPLYMFNKPTDITYDDWIGSSAYVILNNLLSTNPIELRLPMTINDDGTTMYKDLNTDTTIIDSHSETTKLFLGKNDLKELRQQRWDFLDKKDKQCVMDLPNFDKYIFYECTGIKVD